MTGDTADWIVCQIGAREHYSIARALHRKKRLRALVTDAWSVPLPALGKLAPRLASRFHRDLGDAQVKAPTLEAAVRETLDGLTGKSDIDRILRRNAWFQKRAVSEIRKMHRTAPHRAMTVFAYSYAAAEIFQVAKEAGWRTVLGQIDPGPAEAQLVAGLHARHPDLGTFARKPDEYWRAWLEETTLADVIVANSSGAGYASFRAQPRK